MGDSNQRKNLAAMKDKIAWQAYYEEKGMQQLKKLTLEGLRDLLSRIIRRGGR
jgi:hypothetical protein